MSFSYANYILTYAEYAILKHTNVRDFKSLDV